MVSLLCSIVSNFQKYQLIPKEISWLSFNGRVLDEAASADVPLLERLKFLGIFSSNLDEFYRIRVATLKRLAKLGKKAGTIIGYNPKSVLKKIKDIVVEQQKYFEHIFGDIVAGLEKENIRFIDETQFSNSQLDYAHSYFRKKVRPNLYPIMLDRMRRFPELHDASVYLAVILHTDNHDGTTHHALIEIPCPPLPRFLVLTEEQGRVCVAFLDDVIRLFLPEVFSPFGYASFEAYTIKLTRDAELDIASDLEDSVIRKIEKSIKRRQAGNPVRFVYDQSLPDEYLSFLIKSLPLAAKDALIPGQRYHNFKDFIDFTDVNRRHLENNPIVPIMHKAFSKGSRMLGVIGKRDVLLHFPYHSFTHIIDLLREASIDPKVKSIRITLYRLAKNSNVAGALIGAARNGKEVTVVLELQARFDESANIKWARRLQEEGVRVIYGVPGLKVHTKLCLIERREKGETLRYAVMGTGNFNEDTARVYADHALLTSDSRITREANKLFLFFEKNYRIERFKHLIVSPFTMRRRLTLLIDNEMKNAEKGRDAYIILKLNHFVDYKITKKICEASQCGVTIRLIVRGMFSLVPGVSGVSENISAVSIIDRFLEHSRIYIFCNGGEELFFISSSDLMSRNLDSRVEAACPIYDKSIQAELKRYVEIQLDDTVKARVIDINQDNRINTSGSEVRIRAQEEIYRELSKLTNRNPGLVPKGA
jgi:polyphosphate kinase